MDYYWIKQVENELCNDKNPTKGAIIYHLKRLEKDRIELGKLKRENAALRKKNEELEQFIQNWHEDGDIL